MKLRIKGTQIQIRYEAVAVMTAALLLDHNGAVPACLFAALCHELGHILVMLLFSRKLRSVSIGLFDVKIRADEPVSFTADMCITLGGVAVNFILAAVFSFFSFRMFAANIAMGLFNLLPVKSLDGGDALSMLLERRFSDTIVLRVINTLSFVFLAPFMCAGFFILFRTKYNYSLLAVSMYLLSALLLK